MSLEPLPIAEIGEPILRQPAATVTREQISTPQFQAFVDRLIATMRHADGAGIAAPQVFEPLRVCVLEVRDNPRYPYKPNIPLTVLVNPTLSPRGEAQFENYEGCLSVPNLRGVVSRHAEIDVTAWDRHGTPWKRHVKGITAGTFQHEVDHLDGKLFVDRVHDPHSLCTWANFKRHRETEFRRQVERIVARYGS
ncbi:MAG: peptide deformylase [Myxococcales bacterium FL481]|nr:MAG: peptide deformylase [Myxococcales bacterium FL481]